MLEYQAKLLMTLWLMDCVLARCKFMTDDEDDDDDDDGDYDGCSDDTCGNYRVRRVLVIRRASTPRGRCWLGGQRTLRRRLPWAWSDVSRYSSAGHRRSDDHILCGHPPQSYSGISRFLATGSAAVSNPLVPVARRRNQVELGDVAGMRLVRNTDSGLAVTVCRVGQVETRSFQPDGLLQQPAEKSRLCGVWVGDRTRVGDDVGDFGCGAALGEVSQTAVRLLRRRRRLVVGFRRRRPGDVAERRGVGTARVDVALQVMSARVRAVQIVPRVDSARNGRTAVLSATDEYPRLHGGRRRVIIGKHLVRADRICAGGP